MVRKIVTLNAFYVNSFSLIFMDFYEKNLLDSMRKILLPKAMQSCYTYTVAASYSGNREEVSLLNALVSFLVAVAAGVACHYIIKWLDGDK